MEIHEVINNSFKDFIKCQKRACNGEEMLKEFLSSKVIDWKYAWLCEEVFGLSTYDDELSMKFGKSILDVMTAIRNRTTFQYIKDNINTRHSLWYVIY